jgi:hypothetical protein
LQSTWENRGSRRIDRAFQAMNITRIHTNRRYTGILKTNGLATGQIGKYQLNKQNMTGESQGERISWGQLTIGIGTV